MKIIIRNRVQLDSLPGYAAIFAISALGMLSGMQDAAAQEACLNDVAQFNNATCTANDVRISQINVLSGPTECIEGTPVTITSLEAEVLGGAKKRYDIGMYLATDGGDAKASLSGSSDGCVRDLLNPEGEDFDGDFCSDIAQGVTETKPLMDLTLVCRDTDEDGFLDVGTCLSWDNNTKDVCSSKADAFPGTPSKCRCEPIQVGEITVIPKGMIIVEKVVKNIPNDPTAFTFEGDAAGSITENQTISVGGLEPGTYTATEIVPANYRLSDISCDDEDSFGDVDAATATFVVAAEETVTCTFTNSAGG